MVYRSATQRIGLVSSVLSIPEDQSDGEDSEGFSSWYWVDILLTMSRREKLTFVNFCITNLCSGCCYSLLGPFFPNEVIAHPHVIRDTVTLLMLSLIHI